MAFGMWRKNRLIRDITRVLLILRKEGVSYEVSLALSLLFLGYSMRSWVIEDSRELMLGHRLVVGNGEGFFADYRVQKLLLGLD